MAEEIRLSKTVLDRNKFNAVIDRSFKTFVEPVPEQDPDTIQELRFTIRNSTTANIKT